MPRESPESASAITALKCVGVTRLMLCTPPSRRRRKVSRRAGTSSAVPAAPRLMAWFWQKTQRRLHPAKNTAPLPRLPLMQGSSP